MSDLAARLRDAFLGTETGEAVPFDELKDAVKDRWQRVADAAAIRVPFSDEQIERMAEAAHTRRMRDEERTKKWKELPLFAKDAWRQGIRAALAAGGLEPCTVPEYDPSDVALSPTGHVLRDRLVEAEAKIERQRKNLNQLYMANAALRNDINIAVCNAMYRLPDAPWKDKTATEAVWLLSLAVGNLRAEVDEDNAAAASVNDLLIKVQNLTAERDAQEIELADLRFYQREFAAVSAERDALRERASVPVKVRIKRTAHDMERDWLNIVRKYAPEDDNGACPWLQDCLCDFATQIAAHAVIDAPAGVPSVEELIKIGVAAQYKVGIFEQAKAYVTAIRDAVLAGGAALPTIQRMAENQGYSTEPPTMPTPLPSTIEVLNFDRVEALARVLRAAYMKECHVEPSDCPPNPGYLAEARAAIAYLDKRPEGLPTAEELAQIYNRIYYGSAPEKCRVNWESIPEACREDMVRGTEAILTALRPWLRDPVGCEMDVTAEEIYTAWYKANDRSHEGRWQAVLDLCRSRIRPVFECKECAKNKAERDVMYRDWDDCRNRMLKVRLALSEGDES